MALRNVPSLSFSDTPLLLCCASLHTGANLDPALCISEAPTLVVGILAFIATKIAVLFLAGELALGLSRADAVRVSILLAGGGEFAFVVFKLAESLGVLPEQLAKLLTASVILSMSLTPLLGEVAQWAAGYFEGEEGGATQKVAKGGEVLQPAAAVVAGGTLAAMQQDAVVVASKEVTVTAKPSSIVVCGFGEVGQRVCAALEEDGSSTASDGYIAIDRNTARIRKGKDEGLPVVYGDGASESLLRALGVETPRAIIITYYPPGRCLEATSRLHKAFPSSPIYVRSSRQQDVAALKEAGAEEVIVETAESAARFAAFLGVEEGGGLGWAPRSGMPSSTPSGLTAASGEGGWEDEYSADELLDLADEVEMELEQVIKLYEVFHSLDNLNDDKEVTRGEQLRDLLVRTSEVPMDDAALEEWWAGAEEAEEAVDFFGFVRLSATIYDRYRL